MRLRAARTAQWTMRKGVTRLLLVTGVEDERYREHAVVYAFDIEEDGPSSTAWLFEDAECAW